MKIFVDTANVKAIKEAMALGIVDGVTTNPTLVAKEGDNPEKIVKEICAVVEGRPVNAEVLSLKCDEMVKEARGIAKWAKNIVIKIPMMKEGLKTVKILADEGIKSNVTLIFSPTQAILAAKAGASYVSPFVGRLDDISTDGMELISQIMSIYNNYPTMETEVIVASIRHPLHVIQAGLMGADVLTIPPKVLEMMEKHPLTDAGIAAFLEDAKKFKK
ncbi:fructose-6-phosphate aldolase [Candidatus Poribacteria bacterium]|nr:fructose-6-phosphate aldolase [Candidatus Poribacteria bacterium]